MSEQHAAVPSRPELPVSFADGADAVAIGWQAGVLRLLCARAHPPGRPLQLTLHAGEPPLQLVGKSAGSKRTQDGRFEVGLRLHSLRRGEREQLEALFAS